MHYFLHRLTRRGSVNRKQNIEYFEALMFNASICVQVDGSKAVVILFFEFSGCTEEKCS